MYQDSINFYRFLLEAKIFALVGFLVVAVLGSRAVEQLGQLVTCGRRQRAVTPSILQKNTKARRADFSDDRGRNSCSVKPGRNSCGGIG